MTNVQPIVQISDDDLKHASAAEIETYLQYLAAEALSTDSWETWIAAINPQDFPYAPHHRKFWDHIWSIEAKKRPKPFVAIWPRGGGKSSSIEMAIVLLAARKARKYCLYVSGTQEQADDHVLSVGALIESEMVGLAFPDLGARSLGKYGNVRGWRRNRLITQSGFIVDALGLDTAARGLKIENQRPDLIVIDDIDSEADTPAITERKIKTITRSLLPAGAHDAAVVAVQNLVHADSVFAQLSDGRADWLADRIVSGPIQAVKNLTVEKSSRRMKVTGGEPAWEGQDLARAQEMIDDMGYLAFMSECQHETEPPPGGMFDHIEFTRCDPDEVPELVKVNVWVDPAVTSTDDSDAHGIQADGIAVDGTIYCLYSYEQRTTPLECLQRAISKGIELGADTIGVETDQGGATWQSVYREAAESLGISRRDLPRFTEAKGGAVGPKVHRASQMLTDYEHGRIVHVRGTHHLLERALRRFPKTKPLDLVDAAYWAWRALRPERKKRMVITR